MRRLCRTCMCSLSLLQQRLCVTGLRGFQSDLHRKAGYDESYKLISKAVASGKTAASNCCLSHQWLSSTKITKV